jgi:amino acid adenylation domain-containing protein
VQLVVETDYVRFQPGDRIAQASNASFDALTFEAWGAFLNGATLVGIPRDVLLSPPALYRMLRDERITTLYQTTALLNQLSRELPDVFAPLREVLFGGQAVDADSVRRLLKAGGPERLLHMYGPTETTAWCSWEQVAHVAEDALTVSVGRPTGNQRIYLLDAALNPVPVGVPGEAYVGGDGVVRGYLDRPGLTAERFVPDPFAAEPGVRMYRTGDRLRWKADGRLEFIGRVDEQVKVRGFRIEPGEIEAVLSAHAEVREARVIVSDDASGEKRLVAYVVGSVDAEGLRAHLRESLPEYMVPAAFVALERLPLTPTGKLDVRALPAPELGSAEDEYVAPGTPVEEVLAGIWAEVLRLERVGVRENFFEAGGHSLLATRVVSRIREVFGVEMPLRALFEGPTVAELAGRVEEMRRAELPVLPPVVPVERTGGLPLSFAQERLWFMDRLEPGSAVYNIPMARRVGGALDGAVLERALGEIVRRHEALRTVFREVDGSPVQVIAPFAGFAVPVEDLSGLGEADREAAVERRAGEEAARPFDLSAGPLIRAALLRLGDEDHVLLLSMHHIVSDGWSMGVFFREFSVLYEAYRQGRESPLPELPVQYADYAVWQREQLDGEALDRQMAYWRERLAGAPELLELPTDRPRRAVQTYRGASVPVALSPELQERLQALGQSEGTTLFMTLLSAFQVLLSKYAGSEDVVVGSPIAGRTRREVESLIGFFINTLVLRTDVSGDPGFREVLRRVRQVTLGAYEHQEVPFEKLVAELQPERSLSHSPFFQVMFTLQNAGGGGGAIAGLEVSGAGAVNEVATHDLYLVLSATPAGLLGGLNYSTDLFEPATIERMVRHLERLLEQVAADADVRLSRLDLLGEPERALVLGEWNRTEAEYPADRCIHELFEAQAACTPGAVAVSFERAELGYGELNERANRLAHHLAALGVGPETRVAICLERGPEMVVSVLAVLKAGGAYVPLDPAYPAERLAFVLADAAVPVLVTQESLRAALPAGDGVAVVSVDGDGARIAAERAENPDRGARPDQLAYVIYTSGSTGTPKGVMVPHRGVPNLAYAQARRFGIDGTSRVLQFASFSFDAAVAEVFDTLLAGATLVMASREALLPGAGLLETLRRGRVTVATLPPPVLAILPPDELPELRTVVSAGEAVDAATVERWSAGRAFVNAYGPTETTVCATSASCQADGRAPAIGRPLENVRVYVLDAAGQPAPAGVPGELYVGGVGVARGYLGRPGLTAERFVPDPFGGETGARLYRTGDRVRWSVRGELEFLGRVDQQVKIRGFRIEPGEIEAVLRRNAGVADCVVVAREDVPGEKRLVAYVVGGGGADELREHLLRELPEYMVPAAFVSLDALPLTPNGKLDRKALPAPELASGEETYVAPRTPVEEMLAGIWAEVLGLERAGVTESFFDLGGHSILAALVISSIRALFAVELPVRVLFEGPTVAEVANAVEEMRRAELPVLPPVVPVERTGALPLSFAQERLWFTDRLEPGSALYNIPGAWRLGGALDGAALERALGEIVRRHEALRTTFAEVNGSPVQVIAPFGGFSLPVEDLSGLGDADREAAVERRAGEEAVRPFDLAAGPLFRALLLRLGDEHHVLLLSMHHIVSDGWSMGVFFREFTALYAAYREGRESPLPELAVQYADFAVWQREQLEGEGLDRQLAYWRERLAGAPELLELPTDHPRPAVLTYRGASVPVELSPELLERLQALGRSEGTTLYMTLLSAFQVLLSKYAGSEDVVVGSPNAGRTRSEVEGLIGFFINALVLRTDLSGDPSFRETLRRVREVTLGAYEHQEVPFDKLVAELQPERSLSHSPLFQVMFTLQNAGAGGGALPGLQVGGAGAAREDAKHDLYLALSASPRGLHGGLNYSTDLFEPATIQRMVRHLERVLEQVAADADVRLSRLDLLGEAERLLLVEEWNRTEAEYPADRCIHELFEAQAARRPDTVAIEYEGETLSYGSLNERANRLAHHLAALGVGPETRVGICQERGPEMVVSVLAVLKAGGAYVPLDPAYPAERLAFVLADAAVPVLVTQESLRAALPAGDSVVVVSVDGERIAAERAENPDRGARPDQLAYVIYTSGSTGTPKGVMVPHRGVPNLAYAQARRFGIDDTSRVLQFASFSFDAAVAELFDALLAGATLVMGSREALLPGEGLLETLRRGRVTVATLPPPVLAMLAADDLPELRTVVSAGEAVDAATVERWSAGRAFVNAYGPTETTVCATSAACEADGRAPAIGRPLENVRVYVMDAAGQPAPAGVPGELYVGGVGVARGYLGRPGLTAERFVPDPFAVEGGARLYRTGDRVRWSARGELEFLGRVDQQVKIRGFRIEPGEIEGALRRSEGVADCVVVAREDVPGEKRLVAYVVGGVEAGVLREHLLRELPEYMVPSAFVSLDALPLTPNGKLDRKALPAPELASGEEAYVAPRTPVEEMLAGVWAEVLGLERAGVTESFFDLGGHSLLAALVISSIRELFGVELPVRVLFEGPTVAEVAKAVEEMRRAELPVLPPVVPTERTGALPLSFAQERLWFMDRLEPGGAAYNIPEAWRLGGALNEGVLERALGEIVRRHEALRTTFAEVDGSPVQVIAPFGGFALPVGDLSAVSEADREAVVGQRAGEEARRPFDLAAGPLFRAALLRLGAEDRVLLLTMHHVVSDGWSMGVFFRELSALYAAYREGRESPLPELAVQYADYAVWQREQLEGEVLDRQLAYWKERLAGAPELLELPTDRPRPPVLTYRGESVSVEFSPELLERLQALGRSEGTTLYMTLLAAFQVLLGKHAGSEDVVVGSPIAGRTRSEVEGLIGFFVNTLVLRTDLSGDPGFREVLRRVREVTLGAYEHQEVPFEKLVAELQPERSASHSPLFQVMFTLQNDGGGEGRGALPGLQVGGAGGAVEVAKHDLYLALATTPWGLHGELNYSTDLFEPGTMERMVRHLERVLEQVAADPDVRLSRLELLGESERALVLEAWNATDAEFPADACVHELFEAQAERTPESVAVVFEDRSLSYAELNARANRLAHHLRERGVGPDVRVGICVERGPEMVVGLLGVMKAGGAYVPLDPSYPAERLAYMLADSAPAAVLTQRSLHGMDALFAGIEAPVIDVEGAEWADHPVTNPERGALTPAHLAYVIYTSGSTGRPKGVAVPHRGVVNHHRAFHQIVGMEAADRVLAVTTYAFDPSVLEIFLPLFHGARIIVLPRERAADPAGLAEAIQAYAPTVMQATPVTWRMLVQAGWEGAPDVRALCGGEALPAELASALRSRVGALWNVYGPTETTIWSTAEPVRADFAAAAGQVPVGRPLANARVYILDAAGQPVPVRVAGELYIGGAGVVRGYLGRPEQTAERFVADPFGGEPGARMYRTGDLARWRPDGTIEYLGRTDFQVKVRGFRIELGEIEARLAEHPGVREAAVVAREDVPGDQRLVAYVVGDADAEALRTHLSAALPEYMVPAAYVRLDRFPLTPTRKVDRKALPAPEGDAYASREYEAPVGRIEVALAEIWAELLRVERVGRRDHFFELGGHSLLGTRVVSRVREVLGVELPLRTLFERPALSGLAAEIERLRGSGAAAGAGDIAPAGREGDLPVTFAQERLWFVDALDPGSPVYAMPFSFHITGRLDTDALRRALTELVRRHEPLRTTLPAVDGVPVQRIAPPPASFDLPVTDLRHLPEGEQRAEGGRLAAESSRHRFDLARGPLFRGSLVHGAGDEHILLLNLHHAIGDGWSLEVLKEELSALYGAFARGEPSPLPEPALQYADYAVWQRARLSGAVLERQLEFWRQALDGAPALLELPTDRPRPPVESHRGALESLVVAPGLTAEVNALARREGATLFMVLLAALDVVLGRLAGQDDVVVGTPIAGRTRAETERMVGLFLNSLALRTDLSGDPTFRELLGRVRETTLDAYAHQDLPFERVLEEVRPERSMAHAPVFQVMLNLANFQDGTFQAEGLAVAGAGSLGEATSKFDLTLYVGEGDGTIFVNLVYAADLFDARRMRELLAQLEGVLRQAAAAPETRVGALSLATEAARGVLPDPAEPLDDTWRGAVHEVFAARAMETPDALAVEDPRERWTYAELDGATDGVARALADAGVGVGDVVAITGHRSAALVRALLGTMKSGAAFLVLDPAYPPARLAEYVRIARPAVHIHLPAAGDLPREALDSMGETIRATVVIHPRSEEPADAMDSSGDPLNVDVGPDTLAYLSFTSGTTGTPKAVMGRHSSLTHFTPWLAAEFGLSASDRFSLVSGLAHDPLHRDVFTPLQLGAAVVAPEPDGIGTPGYLARWMREAGITVAHLTPAMGQLLADASEGERIDSLRRAFFVGDVLRRADVQRLAALAPNLRVVNYYGSTETQRAVSFHVVDPQAEQKEIIPLGRGIPGVQLLVRNTRGEIAGIGEVGEIWMRSPHLAAGYLGDEALSAERFVANPWTGDPRDRLYRTGDLGRYRPDGGVEPMGRADQQVQVRGFRVELGEVESALAAHAAVKEAAVITREAGAGDRRLVAYWVPVERSAEHDDAALRSHLKALLPEYMVPSAYVRLDRLPLTANGKLDRRALPEPEAVASEAGTVEPRTVTERVIAEVWMEVLGVEKVGVEDDFFVHGGHSLKAAQVLARISRMLEVELPLRVLFESPTVAGLAAAVEASVAAADGGGGAIADALAELEGLSDEEVAALLAGIGEEA